MINMSHFPVLAIMGLFLGAFLVALFGRKSAAVRNTISFIITGGAMVLMFLLIKPIMMDGEVIAYWLGDWAPVSGWAIGIGIEVDALSLFFGLLVAIAVACSCFYSYRYMKQDDARGGYFTPGSYTVSAHVPLGSVVGATPDGRFAGEQLADGGLSPMLGQDAQGPTAVLKSVSKLDNTLLSNGTLLNVKFTPATLEGEAGLRKLADFLRAFTQLKLQHIQFNVVNADTLREAQQRPQDYAGLVVRVAGYSAFFVELSKEIQDDIIRRTAHQL